MSSLQTDFNVSPYHDDYVDKKNYYRVLFKPGVAVQARELTQLQTILQNQIEKFGDNIFKRGTIIEGSSLTYHSSLPYVKIRDNESDGTPVNVSQYDNLYVKNSANVSGFIVKTVAGFESRAPDLNTLFIKYNSSGVDSNTTTFSESETLTIYDPNYNIFKMNVIDGSAGFSNSDTIEVVSALAIQNTTGGKDFAVGQFNVNDTIQNGVANAVIIEANNTANSEALILKIRPLAADLKSANNIKWKFNERESIINANTAATASIANIIGRGARGSILTNSFGKISSVSVIEQGSGYYYRPYVTASISSNSTITNSEISQLDIDPQNFLTTITVANSASNPIGVGYGLTVDEGVIYQKGFFSRVDRQLIVVNKYSNTEFTKSVGFLTEEEIVDSNQDQSLLDNATGTSNFTAPGADRLKLTPVLYVLDKNIADSNTEFLPIVEFADGQPYKQNKRTVYNIIGDEMARRTYEESGDYVLDQFNLTTRDTRDIADSASVFKINVDPGAAYIKGYKVETTTNYSANVDKGTDVIESPNSTIKIGYGNYILVNEMAGVIQFNTGSVINFHSAAAKHVSTKLGNAIVAAGTKIGQARVRCVLLDSGEAGSASAVWRVYLFDIVMNSGQNFSNIKSIYYNGTNKGIGDVVLVGGLATLRDTSQSGLMYHPVNAMKYANSITYTYRTLDQSKQANTTGYTTISPSANEKFPYTGSLNSIEKRDLMITVLGEYQAGANAPGTITTTANSPNVVGSGSMNFLNNFKPGDNVKLANNTTFRIGEVKQIVNTSLMVMSANVGAAITGNAVLYFPNNSIISMTSRSERTANVAANGQMTIFLGNTIANTTGSSVSANLSVAYNVTANSVNPAAKTANRNIYTRIRTANNAGGAAGPWCLGVADAFRLRGVYRRPLTTQNKFTNPTTIDSATDFITVADNVFGDRDQVTYVALAGNTAITGLANNTTYFVTGANSSGFKLATTVGGAVINLTAGTINEAGHRFSGIPNNFNENLADVEDITNDFYIDNNQKEDYLDTSYLYKKPRTSDMGATDGLLIKYDAFTTGPGVKTISSYSINDSANLETLSAGTNINTLEIPEMVGTDGKYYDIRDQFDFRQNSANTIPLSQDPSNPNIINPTEPSDANRFSNAEQKFPLPNSTLVANISYYLARNDRVVLDKTGNFVVVKGIPNVLDTFPAEPKDSLTLQYLRIPPYPSLPFSLSKDTIEILDTKIANEKYGRRAENFKVTTPIDKDQKARIQVKNYRMKDIATLERRMKDLEYYVSFTLAETLARSKFIPSSIDGNLDRFKFGFFADPFSDYRFSDTENTEFWSTITDDKLLPKSNEINIEFFFDTSQNGDASVDEEGFITLPYIEHELMSQNDATIEVIPTPPPVVTPPVTGGGNTTPTPTPTPTPSPANNQVYIPDLVASNVVTQSIATAKIKERTTARSDSGSVFEETLFTFSTLAGPVDLYMNHRDNNMAIEVYQRTTPSGAWTLTTSSASATLIRRTDLANRPEIRKLNQGQRIENIDDASPTRKSYGPAGGFIEDQQKLRWNHNPTRGIYYRIRVYKGLNHGGQGKKGTFEYLLYYPTDTITTSTRFVINPNSFDYIGTTTSVAPATFTLMMSYLSLDGTGYTPDGYIADSQKFTIKMTGLKPNTYHKFIFSGEDNTAKCKQIRTNTTNTTGLLSDNKGALNFDYYYDAGIDEATTDVTKQNKLASSSAGVKVFTVQSSDRGSIAAGKIELKYYAGISPATLGSYGSLNGNVLAALNSYNYSVGLSSVVDNTTSSPTSTSDDNTTHINFSGGGGSSISGGNIRNVRHL